MPRQETLLIALQAVIGGFAVIGCIVSSLNYGLEYPSYLGDAVFSKAANFTPSARPTKKDYETVDEIVQAFNWRAGYDGDSRTSVMIPMLATAALSVVLAGAMMVDVSVCSSTSVINSVCVMWLLHFLYLITFTDHYFYNNEEAARYFSASYSPVLALQMIMITLLTLAFAGNAYYIRRRKIAWPGCNCLKLFTINSIFVMGRVVFGSVLLPFCSELFSSGLRPSEASAAQYCFFKKRQCGLVRLPAPIVFGSTSVLALNLIVAGEALLSLVFGEGHVTLTIFLALLSAFANFVLSGAASEYAFWTHSQMPWGFSLSVLCQAALAVLHAWLLWSAPAFINSAPNVLKLVCGYTPKPAADLEPQDEVLEAAPDTAAEDGDQSRHIQTEGQESNGGVVERGDQLTDELLTRQSRNVRALKFALNISIAVVGLVSLSMAGFAIEQANMLLWCQLLLVLVLTVVVTRSSVSLMVLVSSAARPVVPTLQTALEETLLLVVLMISAAATRFYHVSALPDDAAYGGIVVLILKVAELSQCPAFRQLCSPRQSSRPSLGPHTAARDQRSPSVESDTNTLSTAPTSPT
ncbi:hypothetical protein FHG87_013112 [Trinorchestia longiramus]|nr:hypothetical protein FHG87_013112 [Trinorchestia longiramus]